MNIIILVGALLMQLAAAGLLLRYADAFTTRWPWYLGAGGLLLASSLTGLAIYENISSAQIFSLRIITGLIGIIGYVLLLVGVYWGTGKLISTRRSLQSLQGRYDYHQTIFENTPQLLALKKVNGEYVRVNPALGQFLGMESQAIEGKTDFDFLPRVQATAFRERDLEAIEKGLSPLEEVEVLGAEGKKWLEITRMAIHDDRGEPEWILVSAWDITGRKVEQAGVLHRSQTLKTLLEGAEDQFRHARILAAIATHFIQTPAEKIDESINYALQTIGQLSEVDRIYLSIFSPEGQTLNTISEWSAEGIDPLDYHLGDLNLNGTTWWMSKLSRLETIHIPRPDDLPPEASQTAEFLKTHGIKSLTVIPWSRKGH